MFIDDYNVHEDWSDNIVLYEFKWKRFQSGKSKQLLQIGYKRRNKYLSCSGGHGLGKWKMRVAFRKILQEV